MYNTDQVENAKVENAKVENAKVENVKVENAKVENAETWKCKMYFMMSRLGHCNLRITCEFH